MKISKNSWHFELIKKFGRPWRFTEGYRGTMNLCTYTKELTWSFYKMFWIVALAAFVLCSFMQFELYFWIMPVNINVNPDTMRVEEFGPVGTLIWYRYLLLLVGFVEHYILGAIAFIILAFCIAKLILWPFDFIVKLINKLCYKQVKHILDRPYDENKWFIRQWFDSVVDKTCVPIELEEDEKSASTAS